MPTPERIPDRHPGYEASSIVQDGRLYLAADDLAAIYQLRSRQYLERYVALTRVVPLEEATGGAITDEPAIDRAVEALADLLVSEELRRRAESLTFASTQRLEGPAVEPLTAYLTAPTWHRPEDHPL